MHTDFCPAFHKDSSFCLELAYKKISQIMAQEKRKTLNQTKMDILKQE